MQISGANLLLAAQQQTHAPQRAAQHPAFAAALSKANEAGEAEFAPLSFKAAEPAPGPAMPAARQPEATEQKPAQKPGSTLDIRV
jgi:hypothetical protein